MFTALPRIFGHYIVLDELASGGMAKVYRGKRIDNRVSTLVAIKRLRASAIGNDDLTRMFIDEARLAAQLVHPNIVQTYELGRDDECLFIVMEHVWGETCASAIAAAREQGEPIPAALACSIVMRAAEGLDFAHRARSFAGMPLNLVHRDVSPHNVLISHDGEVKLIDFGVAKSDLRDHRTQPGIIKGKLRYMAPEQVTGGAVDMRTDVFGLGLVLYELLKGERAFDGSNAVIIFEKILTREPSALDDSVPESLRRVVAKALAKPSDDRYQTVADFMDALAPFAFEATGPVGQKQIRAFMASLFPGRGEQARELTRRYSAVSPADCVNFREAHTLMRDQVPDFPKTVIAAVRENVHTEQPTRVLAPPPFERRGRPAVPVFLVAVLLVSAVFWTWIIARIVT